MRLINIAGRDCAERTVNHLISFKVIVMVILILTPIGQARSTKRNESRCYCTSLTENTVFNVMQLLNFNVISSTGIIDCAILCLAIMWIVIVIAGISEAKTLSIIIIIIIIKQLFSRSCMPCNFLPRGTPQYCGGGVPSASSNPYPFSDQIMRFSLPNFRPDL